MLDLIQAYLTEYPFTANAAAFAKLHRHWESASPQAEYGSKQVWQNMIKVLVDRDRAAEIFLLLSPKTQRNRTRPKISINELVLRAVHAFKLEALCVLLLPSILSAEETEEFDGEDLIQYSLTHYNLELLKILVEVPFIPVTHKHMDLARRFDDRRFMATLLLLLPSIEWEEITDDDETLEHAEELATQNYTQRFVVL